MFGTKVVDYKTIRSDFSFIEEYGYIYKTDVGGDWAAPSVLWSNGSKDIEVGYDRFSKKIFVYIHTDGTLRNGTDLLANMELVKNYKKQYEVVKEFLIDYLQKE